MNRYLLLVALLLSALALVACPAEAPGAYPTATPTPPTTSPEGGVGSPGCAPESEYCDPPAPPLGVDLAPVYIERHYPEQDIGGLDWQPATRRPDQRTADLVLSAGDWIMVEDFGSSVAVTNTVTGFQWEGEVKSRAVPWSSPCCKGMNYEEYIIETSVTVPPPGAPAPAPMPGTPTRTAQ